MKLLAHALGCDTTILDHTKAHTREGEMMKTVLLFTFFIGAVFLFLGIHNDVSRLRNTELGGTLIAERDTTLVEGEQYGVVPVGSILKTVDELALHNPELCGKYFYTIQRSNEMYIGFRLPLSETGVDPKRIPRYFPKSRYRVMTVEYDQPSPTVEFNEGEIIVRLNKNDLNKAPCFREHTLI
jgi:hypothetical protein